MTLQTEVTKLAQALGADVKAINVSLAGKAPSSHVGSGGTSHAAATTTVAGFMSAADKAKLDGVATGAQANAVTSVSGRTGAVVLAKADVGLSNVDNTTDAAKPVSTAQQTALNLKSNLVSPAFTGTPTTPTAAAGTNTTQIASTAFVRAEVAALVASAPAALDTLDELAAALGDDPNFATSTATAIGLKAPIESPTFTGTVGGITKTMVGLSNVDNTADTAKPVSTAQQTALNLKSNLASPAFTGTPTAPTAAATTNDTQLATTAFVQAVNLSDTGSAATALTLKTARTIAISGGATGTATSFNGGGNISIAVTGLNMGNATAGTLAVARGGTGTTTSTGTGANVQAVSPALTGTPTVPTATASTNNTQAASTAFVQSGLANKQDTLVSGSNIKTVNGVSLLGPGDIAIAGGGAVKEFYFYTADTTVTVPAGVATVRFYAGGKGGDGAGAAGNLRAGGGGGGGFAFGDLAVAEGDTVAFTVTAGVARVSLNGVVAGTATAGSNGTASSGTTVTAGGAGGTASIAGIVTNGGAYTGGKGGSASGQVSVPMGAGGGSSGSPLGPGVAGGNVIGTSGSISGFGGAGAGIGGGAADNTGSTIGGGGAGEAGSSTYGGGSTSDGSTRSIVSMFSDPLLRLAIAPRTVAGSTPWSGAGGYDSAGGDFGGGSGVPAATPLLVGYAGGLMAGGGGIGTLTYNSAGNKSGGAGGFGGGGGAVGRGSGTGSGVGGAGGAAFCFLYY